MRKNRIRLNEAQLQQVIKESVRDVLNEITTYKDTMKNAGEAFGNTWGGKVRRVLNPGKYKQYKRVQQRAKQIGQDAADEYNTFADNMPMCDGKAIFPSYGQYGLNNGYNGDDYGEAWEYGKKLFDRQTDKSVNKCRKYGNGGRVIRPTGTYRDDAQYDRRLEDYKQQQQNLGRDFKETDWVFEVRNYKDLMDDTENLLYGDRAIDKVKRLGLRINGKLDDKEKKYKRVREKGNKMYYDGIQTRNDNTPHNASDVRHGIGSSPEEKKAAKKAGKRIKKYNRYK